MKDQSAKRGGSIFVCKIMEHGLLPYSIGSWRKLKDNAASVSATGRQVAPNLRRTVQVAGRVEDKASVREPSVLAPGEHMKHGLLPTAAGGWREPENRAAANSNSGNKAR